MLSIVTEQCREDGSKRLLISASGADEAKKAKVLLEVHLKNQVHHHVRDSSFIRHSSLFMWGEGDLEGSPLDAGPMCDWPSFF